MLPLLNKPKKLSKQECRGMMLKEYISREENKKYRG